MADSFDQVIAVLYQDGERCLWLANTPELVAHFKNEGKLTFAVKELQDLLGTSVVPKLVIDSFENGMIEIVKLDKQEEMFNG